MVHEITIPQEVQKKELEKPSLKPCARLENDLFFLIDAEQMNATSVFALGHACDTQKGDEVLSLMCGREGTAESSLGAFGE